MHWTLQEWNVPFSFEKLNMPAYREEIARKQNEEEALWQKIKEWQEYTVGATGYRPEGFDTLFFWSVHSLKKKYPHIQNVVAIPFKKQDIRWSKVQRQWYQRMLAEADEAIDVTRLPLYGFEFDPKPDEYSPRKMHKRNAFIVD